jgi:2-oxoisovalerate dehydrogenase E1 component alpha subunit
MLEPMVSRLHGHSSSSGAARVAHEQDCIDMFQQKLLHKSLLSQEEIDRAWNAARGEAELAAQQASREPQPTPGDVRRHTYAPSSVDSVYPDDYTGLPE